MFPSQFTFNNITTQLIRKLLTLRELTITKTVQCTLTVYDPTTGITNIMNTIMCQFNNNKVTTNELSSTVTMGQTVTLIINNIQTP